MDDTADSGFPLVIAGLSTLAALALFFTATVPAMQEDRHLRQVETERRQVHAELWQALDEESSRLMALEVDIQSLMVELDRQGIDPRQIVEPPTTDPGTQPPPAGPADHRGGGRNHR